MALNTGLNNIPDLKTSSEACCQKIQQGVLADLQEALAQGGTD